MSWLLSGETEISFQPLLKYRVFRVDSKWTPPEYNPGALSLSVFNFFTWRNEIISYETKDYTV